MTRDWHAWREARPRPAVLHLQSAACGRASSATIRAVTDHLERESTHGGYAAELDATDSVAALRTDLAGLMGTDPDGIALVESASIALDLLLRSWPLPQGARVGLTPSEWGPNVDALVHHGLRPQWLAVDGDGVLDLDALETTLATDPPAVVHLVQLASHRGLVQPVAAALALCRANGVPLWVDAAQALGHLDTSYAADAVYAPGRKWLTGPRGTGVLAVDAAHRHVLRLPHSATTDVPVVHQLTSDEASVAGRLGLAQAVREHLDAGPARVRERLAERGDVVREVLAGVTGWEVADAPGTRAAIVGLRPAAGQDVTQVQAWLHDEHAILATACLSWRSPGDRVGPLLRISPHVDTTDEDVTKVVAALASRSW